MHGGPDSLVGGEQAGIDHWLSGRGRLAKRARQVFGGPQDVEFGFDAEGRL